MNWIDWIVIIVMGYGVVTGWMNGLVRTPLSVAALVAAFLFGPVLRPFALQIVDVLMTGDPLLKGWIATALSYGVIYLSLSIVGIIWSRFLAKGTIGTSDKVAGLALGGALSAIVLVIPLALVLAIPALASAKVVTQTMGQSKLLPYLKPIAPLMQSMAYSWLHPPVPSASPSKVPPPKSSAKPPANKPGTAKPAKAV
ncbi:MAG: CvpA family protein [Candidatus Sericytochromatia bacterium]|nr:CvpA family protein [Candidatus Sericytochromatia bacterium]